MSKPRYRVMQIELLVEPENSDDVLDLLSDLRDDNPRTIVEWRMVDHTKPEIMISREEAIERFDTELPAEPATRDVLDVLAQYEDTNGLTKEQQVDLLAAFCEQEPELTNRFKHFLAIRVG